jgi:hypothetical protein
MNIAGKFSPMLSRAKQELTTGALSPAKTAAMAPLAYGLIGAGGSVAGNLSDEENEGAGRILTEAALAGLGGAAAGRAIGQIGKENIALQRGIGNLEREATPYISRALHAAEAGARETAKAANQKAIPMLERLGKQQQLLNLSRAEQGAAMAAAPIAAGIGGLVGGGVSNVAGLMLPGFQQQQQYVDPEQYGSSNTMGARASTTTSQYL